MFRFTGASCSARKIAGIAKAPIAPAIIERLLSFLLSEKPTRLSFALLPASGPFASIPNKGCMYFKHLRAI
jgi:hypothetical protein